MLATDYAAPRIYTKIGTSSGETPIYTTDSSNNALDIKLGMNDDILPTSTTFTGLTTYDRDPFGYAAAARNSSGTSAWSFANLFSGCAASGNLGGATSGFTGTSMTSCSPNGLQFAYRTDGYFDGTMTFRGVRTYASDTQQWATPDMYQGMASDPMSQMGYNYAGNNPAMFADPSGFDTVSVSPDDGCPSGFTQTGVNSDGSLMCDNGQQSNLPIIASLTTGALGCRITCGDLSGGHSEIVPGAGGHWQVTPCERGGAGLFKCGGKTVSVMASPGCVLGGAASGVATGSGLVSLSKGATAYATFSAARQGGSALLESALAGGKAFLPSTPVGWIGLGISAGIGGIIGGTRAAATGCGVPAWGG